MSIRGADVPLDVHPRIHREAGVAQLDGRAARRRALGGRGAQARGAGLVGRGREEDDAVLAEHMQLPLARLHGGAGAGARGHRGVHDAAEDVRQRAVPGHVRRRGGRDEAGAHTMLQVAREPREPVRPGGEARNAVGFGLLDNVGPDQALARRERGREAGQRAPRIPPACANAEGGVSAPRDMHPRRRALRLRPADAALREVRLGVHLHLQGGAHAQGVLGRAGPNGAAPVELGGARQARRAREARRMRDRGVGDGRRDHARLGRLARVQRRAGV